jgi:membrane-associated phospholipid phosphatase
MRAFRTVFLVTTFGYYLSYLGYVAFPAIGPRFTLHAFEQTDAELPGLFATEALREYTNAGESIPSGTPSPERVVQRDAFPSGHTQMTLMVIVLAFYYRAGSRWYLGVVGTLLIVATVYLRYHYVVDLAAGALLAAATMFLSAPLQRWLRALPARLGASPS